MQTEGNGDLHSLTGEFVDPSSSPCSEETPNTLLVISNQETTSINGNPVTWKIILASILAACGGILFGYDVGKKIVSLHLNLKKKNFCYK